MNSNHTLENMILLTKKDYKRAAKVSGRAFLEDPFLKYAYPDEQKRKKNINLSFEIVYKLGLYNGIAYAISEKLEGIAIWSPPEKVFSSFWTMIKSGVVRISLKMMCDWKTMKKSIRVFTYMEAQHKRLMPNDHWYLQHLVVEPVKQGKGYGSALLRAMFEKIDAQGLPIYVDTNNPKNIPFYQKHGFKILVEEIIPKTGVPLWCMVRDPKEL